MIYPPRHNLARNPFSKLILLGLGIVFLLGIFLYFFVPTFFPGLLHQLGRPLWQADNTASIALGTFFESFRGKELLVAKNESLAEELSALRWRLAALEMLEWENAELKGLLNRRDERTSTLAAVLTRPNLSPYDTLIVDAGSAQGIHVGDPVLVEGAIQIGAIARVFSETAIVKLFSTRGETIAVHIGRAGIEAEAMGRNGGNFEMKLPREADVSLGDRVFIPGVNPALLGIVEHISLQPADPFALILFKSPVNPYEIRYVEIQTSYATSSL